MRGSLKRLGENRWRLIYDLHSTGKRCQRVVTFYGNKRDAQAKLAELITQARGGFLGSKQNVRQYMDGWIESRTLAPLTLVNYRGFVRMYIAPHIGQVPLEELTPMHLQRLYSSLLKHGGKNEKPLSAVVVRNVHGLLRTALGDAVKMGLLTSNPAERVRAPGGKHKQPEVLSPVRLQECVQALQETPYGFLAWLAALTGLRRGELLGLEAGDVRIQEGVIEVRRSVDRLGNVKLPKNGKPRLVPLPLDVRCLRQIEDYVRDHPGRLFDFPAGSLSSGFGSACAAVGFAGVHLHTFRHSVASILIKNKVHPKAVQELLGHHDVRFTMSQYAHLMPGMFEETARVLGDLVRDQTVITEAEKPASRLVLRGESAPPTDPTK